MGLTVDSAKYIALMKKKYDIDFSNLATLGRQYWYYDNGRRFKKEISQFFDCSQVIDCNGYGDPFFRLIGDGENCVYDIVDYSDYEGANILCDMNKAVPDNLKNKYTVLIDGGLLEHVFNFPIAISNVMNMVKQGGFVILLTPTNNWSGHGFYQFSPELFYSIFHSGNGYEIVDMSYAERSNRTGKVVRIRRLDGHAIDKSRVQINSRYQSELFIIAKRVGDVPREFDIQQADYLREWEGSKSISHNRKEFIAKIKKIALSYRVFRFIYYRFRKYKRKFRHIEGVYSLDKELRFFLK